MKRYKRSQLNAISVSYTDKANKEAHQRLNDAGLSDDHIMLLKRAYNLKTTSYVVLEKAFIRRGILYDKYRYSD